MTEHEKCQYKRSPLILKNFLDGNHFPRVTELGLVHNTEASIADHLRRMRMMRLWSMFYTTLTIPWCRCRTPPWSGPDPGPGSQSPSSPCCRPCLKSSSRQSLYCCTSENQRTMWCGVYWSSCEHSCKIIMVTNKYIFSSWFS